MGDCCVVEVDAVEDDAVAACGFFAPKRLEADAEPSCGAPGDALGRRLTFPACELAAEKELGGGGAGGGAGGAGGGAATFVGWDADWACCVERTGDPLRLRLSLSIIRKGYSTPVEREDSL